MVTGLNYRLNKMGPKKSCIQNGFHPCFAGEQSLLQNCKYRAAGTAAINGTLFVTICNKTIKKLSADFGTLSAVYES
jgi:hypothetical protein